VSAKVKQQPPGKTDALTIVVTNSMSTLSANKHSDATSKLKALIGVISPTSELSSGSSDPTQNSSPPLNVEARAHTPDTPYNVSPPFQVQDGWTGVPPWAGLESYGGGFADLTAQMDLNHQKVKNFYLATWEASGHGGDSDLLFLQYYAPKYTF
jgi:hypothetical protein